MTYYTTKLLRDAELARLSTGRKYEERTPSNQGSSTVLTSRFTNEYRIDISNVPDPPKFIYTRKVKYWKGRRYVYHTKRKHPHWKMVDKMADEICKQIDEEVFKTLKRNYEQGLYHGTTQEGSTG